MQGDYVHGAPAWADSGYVHDACADRGSPPPANGQRVTNKASAQAATLGEETHRGGPCSEQQRDWVSSCTWTGRATLAFKEKEHALHAEAIHFSRDTACTQTMQTTRQDTNYASRHKTQTTQRALTAPKTYARARHTRGIHSWREIRRGCTRQGSSRSLWPAKLQLVPAAKDSYLRLQTKRGGQLGGLPSGDMSDCEWRQPAAPLASQAGA